MLGPNLRMQKKLEYPPGVHHCIFNNPLNKDHLPNLKTADIYNIYSVA